MKKIIETIKARIKNFLKEDFNNWYVRLCCLCFSLTFMISAVVTVVEVWFVSFKHMDFVYGQPVKWLIVSVLVTFVLVGLQLWLSKLFYRLYNKIKSLNVQNI